LLIFRDKLTEELKFLLKIDLTLYEALAKAKAKEPPRRPAPIIVTFESLVYFFMFSPNTIKINI